MCQPSPQASCRLTSHMHSPRHQEEGFQRKYVECDVRCGKIAGLQANHAADEERDARCDDAQIPP